MSKPKKAAKNPKKAQIAKRSTKTKTSGPEYSPTVTRLTVVFTALCIIFAILAFVNYT